MMWAGFFMIATVASFAVCVASVAMQPEFLPGITDESFSAFCPPSRKGDDLADDVVGLDELDHRPGGRNAVGPFHRFKAPGTPAPRC